LWQKGGGRLIHLTPDEFADMSEAVSALTREQFKKSLRELNQLKPEDEKIIDLASACAGIAVSFAIQYLNQKEQHSELQSQGLIQ
jgi:hypothetical protein